MVWGDSRLLRVRIYPSLSIHMTAISAEERMGEAYDCVVCCKDDVVLEEIF